MSSDHAILGLRKQSTNKRRQVVRIDWDVVNAYLEREGKNEHEERSSLQCGGKQKRGEKFDYVGEAYE